MAPEKQVADPLAGLKSALTKERALNRKASRRVRILERELRDLQNVKREATDERK